MDNTALRTTEELNEMRLDDADNYEGARVCYERFENVAPRYKTMWLYEAKHEQRRAAKFSRQTRQALGIEP